MSADHEHGNRATVAFIAVAYGLAGVVSVAVWATGGHESPLVGLGFVVMLVPALSVAIIRALMNTGPSVDWHRLPPRYVPAALLVIPVTLNVLILFQLSNAGAIPWQEWLTPDADSLFHSPESRGWGTLTTPALIGRIALNAFVGLAVVSVLALGEEIGWRGWLLPRLAQRVGPRSAVIVTTIVWAVWHVPFGLSGIHHIEGLSPLQVALGIPVGVGAVGLILGWLWVRTESIWIVALAHGASNNWGQYALKYMQDFSTPDPTAVLGNGFLALYVVGIVLLIFGMPRRRLPSP